MKTIGKILGGIALLLVIAFAGSIGKIIGKSTSERFFEGKKEGTIDAVLIQIASEINKKLPMMVDANTRLDSTVGINRTVRYNYTLVKYTAEELDATALEQAMRPKLINNVCTTKEMEFFVKNNITVSYAYFGKNGKQVTVITVPASSCRNGS